MVGGDNPLVEVKTCIPLTQFAFKSIRFKGKAVTCSLGSFTKHEVLDFNKTINDKTESVLQHILDMFVYCNNGIQDTEDYLLDLSVVSSYSTRKE